MTVAKALLKARSVGVRDFRDHASKIIKSHQFYIITDHGRPTRVLLPYNDILEIVDILDELQDKMALKTIAEGRRDIRKGARGVSVAKVFAKS